MGHKEGYILPNEVIFDKIQETLDLGGTGVLMQGGLHPDLKIEWYEDLFRSHQGSASRFICTASPRPRSPTSPKSAACRCATPSPACGTPAWIPFPAAAPRSSTTPCATASAG